MCKIHFCLLLYLNDSPLECAVNALPQEHKFLIVKKAQHRRLDQNTLNIFLAQGTTLFLRFTLLKYNVKKCLVKLIVNYSTLFKDWFV